MIEKWEDLTPDQRAGYKQEMLEHAQTWWEPKVATFEHVLDKSHVWIEHTASRDIGAMWQVTNAVTDATPE